ncbi:MAG: hypothetical protein OXM01_11560 [Gemmatimonadota bacterium]|nr:hypothetical protein [Gemmatimonadota bacterium]
MKSIAPLCIILLAIFLLATVYAEETEEGRFPNLLYKLEEHKSRQAAFYGNRYKMTQPQYTTEEMFKAQATQVLVGLVGAIEQVAWARRYVVSQGEMSLYQQKVEYLSAMRTVKMKECFPLFKPVVLSSDSLSCQTFLAGSQGKPITRNDKVEAQKACAKALHDQAQELGCFSLSGEDQDHSGTESAD